MSSSRYVLQQVMSTPAPITSLAMRDGVHLFAGSSDGRLRVYRPPAINVQKAIQGLGSEISSIVPWKQEESSPGSIWLACGRQALSFTFSSEGLVMRASDATSMFELCEGDQDVLNELALSPNKKYLAFSCDSGTVGTVDLNNGSIMRMRTRHSSICGTVKFVPHRSCELVSGGYDSTLLHANYAQGSLLSMHEMISPPQVSGIALMPPFVLSMAMSATAVLAAGTADGQLWIGAGGEKRVTTNKKNRSRKWGGLRNEGSVTLQVAEGPVVAVEWTSADTLITCTLLGNLSRYHMSRDPSDDILRVEVKDAWPSNRLVRVNAMVSWGEWLAVGGFGADNKGIIEIWRKEAQQDVMNIS